ncbi:MAG: hemerythrin domain-containing protein [Planctomycetes bacterium]|nr:hemerythrin domain-containing protein [Planctomycetota bacterium]
MESDASFHGNSNEVDWENRSLTELVDYIENYHHDYMSEALPRFFELMELAKRHPDSEGSKIFKALQHFSSLLAEGYINHARREENLLFPYIREMEAYASGDKEQLEDAEAGGLIFKSMASIDNEHDQIIDTLTRMKAKEVVAQMPEDAPEPFGELHKIVLEIAADLKNHAQLEDKYLFPRAVELEKNLGLH